MKITLEYGDEDRQEAWRALRVDDYGLVLWDMQQHLVACVNDENYTDVETAHYRLQLKKLDDLMTLHGVEFPE